MPPEIENKPDIKAIEKEYVEVYNAQRDGDDSKETADKLSTLGGILLTNFIVTHDRT